MQILKNGGRERSSSFRKNHHVECIDKSKREITIETYNHYGEFRQNYQDANDSNAQENNPTFWICQNHQTSHILNLSDGSNGQIDDSGS